MKVKIQNKSNGTKAQWRKDKEKTAGPQDCQTMSSENKFKALYLLNKI